jgi:hypothetical protein
MVLDAISKRRTGRFLRAAFFLGVMGCGYLVLYISLPPRRGDAASLARRRLQALMGRLTEGVRIEPGRWRMIVIHHSATAGGNAARFHEYHLYEHGWEGGLGYHFVIGNGHGSGDGEIEIGWRWPAQRQGIHVRGYNLGAIGICLVGNFEEKPPTKAQMAALLRLVRCLMDLCGLSPPDLRLHGELVATRCPGRHFPAKDFRAALAVPMPSE